MAEEKIYPFRLRIDGNLLDKKDHINITKYYLGSDEKAKYLINEELRKAFVIAINKKFNKCSRYDQFSHPFNILIKVYINCYDGIIDYLRTEFVRQIFIPEELYINYSYDSPYYVTK
jgi:hypothetical protein